MKNKKAQTWSIDLIMGVVLFLLLIVIVYALLRTDVPKDTELRTNADQVYSRLDATNNPNPDLPPVIRGNKLSEADLKALYAEDYNTLKAKLGITGEFCILVVDDYGGIVDMADFGFEPQYSVGEGGELEIAEGIYCGE